MTVLLLQRTQLVRPPLPEVWAAGAPWRDHQEIEEWEFAS
jgi:hypothetical protein